MNLNRLSRLPEKALSTARLFRSQDTIVLNWATEGIVAKNWGDKLNPDLAHRLSGLKVMHRADVIPYPGLKLFYVLGSHLATACNQPGSVVWGAGFISSTVGIRGEPDEIHAVRGWLSAERLRKHGIACPDVVGDPALLLPLFYAPKPRSRRYALGVIPHCLEWYEPFFLRVRTWEDTLLIDITGGIEEVVDQICACDRIVSTSLHGIICADGYGVPALWLHASEKVGGDGFKFRDYFSSVGRPDLEPIRVDASTPREALLDGFFDYTLDFDRRQLLQCCPFWNGVSPPGA